MKSSTPLIRVVTEGLFLGAYETRSWPEAKLIEFLASYDGTFTVGGAFPSVESGLLWRLRLEPDTFTKVVRRLIKARVLTTIKLGYSTTYALTEAFLLRCRSLYDIRWERDLVERYHNDAPDREAVATGPASGVDRTGRRSHHERRKEDGRTTTADAAPPSGGGEEPMTDHPTDDGFYGDPKRRRRSGESPALGADPTQRLGETKAVRHRAPRGKDVEAVKEYFQSKLLAFSEAKSVPLWDRVGKMHNNIKFMTERHPMDIIERAIDYFASQVSMMMFQGTTLWDEFFARRDDYLRYAATAGIGSHGAHTETQEEEARRLARRQYEAMQQQNRSN